MKVALFITCLNELFFPRTGLAMVKLLEHLGVQVTFPEAQTCCGQPQWNSGYRDEARGLARHFLDVFQDAEYIVTPSGSCAGMVHHSYPEICAGDPSRRRRSLETAARTYEFTQFLVDVLKRPDVGARFPARATYHASCHMTRFQGVVEPPLQLLRHVQGLELVPLERPDLCCGFGGTFAVKSPEVSVAMADEKLADAGQTGAIAAARAAHRRPAGGGGGPAVSTFRERARAALQDARLQRAIRTTTNKFFTGRRAQLADLAPMAAEGFVLGDFAAMRDRAKAVKTHVMDHLDHYLGRAVDAIAARGGQVHFARDAAEVGTIVAGIARSRGVDLAVKSKSMASEEVHLNAALEQGGVEVVETDLGEWIIQLAGETPSHVVVPAIHKTRQDVALLFGAAIGQALSTDTPTLTAVARRVLREKFLAAGLGISGANFVVAETGTLCLVTNEGNGRLVTSAPRVHVAVVGIEKVIPALPDLALFLSLLARSATGQHISVYTHMVTGPRRPDEADGPEELHVVFMDAGRSGILGSEYQDVLHCIRCGACLNHCPVYRNVGGHAYGGVYSGPIGTVLTPLLGNFADWTALPTEACSLCAACDEVCPVGIPLHALILKHRQQVVQAGLDRSGLGLPLRVTSALWERPWAYRLTMRLGRLALRLFSRPAAGGGRWLVRAPGPAGGWTAGRDVPAPEGPSFRALWARHQQERGRTQ